MGKKNNPVDVEGIDHVVLNVTNIERSLDFYTGVLGGSLERIIEDFHIHQVRFGRNLIDLIALPPGSTLAEKGQRGLDHVCLHVRGDMDDIMEHLKKHKIQTSSPLREIYGSTGFGTSIYILDPDNHQIELKANYSQYPIKTTGAAFMATMTRPKT